MVIRKINSNELVSNFYFTEFKTDLNTIYLSANFVNEIKHVKIKIKLVDEYIIDDINESSIIIPFENNLYLIDVEYCNDKISYDHCHDINIHFEREYYKVIPPVIYIVVCGMISTKI
jgi:hypothetical protein